MRGRRLPVLLLTVLLALPVAPARAQTVESHEWDLIARLNHARWQAGLDALVVRDDLRALARGWSQRMAAENRLWHNPNLWADVGARIPSRGAVGENIARAGSVPRLHELWMGSPRHRANILGDWDYVGVGVAGDYWGTQVFADAAPGLPGISRVPVTRLSGPNAVETALMLSRRDVPAGSAEAVVVARVDVFPDALVGAPLAGANSGSVLLSPSEQAPASVVDEARRAVRPGGAVYLMGGPSALSPTVEAQFLATGQRVQRVAGRDRFETAVHAATLLNPAPGEVLLASGENFADALSAGVPAAVHRLPIVLTMRDALPASTATYLAVHPAARRIALGGAAAVSAAVAAQAGAAERVAGSNRYATSVQVARRWFPQPSGAWIATGDRHQDPLVAVPGAARERRPLILVSGAGERNVYEWSRQHLAALESATVVGGTAAVREPVLSLLFN